ncbi:MAG: hypothetical protein E6G44_05925 [Actinobacteria bacterium]|nr:MAG: hypothetical protein E6G44_05925 [Actinomycetota bacterium]
MRLAAIGALVRARAIRRRLGDERGYVRALIIQTALGMLVIGLAINDGGQLIAAQVRAESVARAAAQAGADTYFRLHKVDAAKSDAYEAAAEVDPTVRVTDFSVASDGTVTVRVEKLASTIVVKRVGFLKRFNTQGATDSEVRTS